MLAYLILSVSSPVSRRNAPIRRPIPFICLFFSTSSYGRGRVCGFDNEFKHGHKVRKYITRHFISRVFCFLRYFFLYIYLYHHTFFPGQFSNPHPGVSQYAIIISSPSLTFSHVYFISLFMYDHKRKHRAAVALCN